MRTISWIWDHQVRFFLYVFGAYVVLSILGL